MAWLTERTLESEMLDESVHDSTALELNLRHLAGVSRWLGGERTIVTYLRSHLARQPGEDFVALDVGAGGADLARRIVNRFNRNGGSPVTVHALDRQLPVAKFARRWSRDIRGVHVLVGEGAHLPFADNSVDLAYSSTTLHHLSEEQAVRFVAELGRVARYLVVVGDLDRNVVALVCAHLLAATWWRRSPYRADGPLSVRRAFTKRELLDVGRAAGLAAPRVNRHFPFRLALVGGSA